MRSFLSYLQGINDFCKADLIADVISKASRYVVFPARGSKLCAKTKVMIGRTFSCLSSIFGDVKSVDVAKLTASCLGLDVRTVSTHLRNTPPEVSLQTSPRTTALLPPCSIVEKVSTNKEETGKRLLSTFETITLDHIRATIHRYYRQYRKVCVAELNERLSKDFDQTETNWKVSDRTLNNLLNAMGFRFKKVRERVQIYENNDLIDLRHKYLRTMSDLRKENAFICYTDETWVFEGMDTSHNWVDLQAYG